MKTALVRRRLFSTLQGAALAAGLLLGTAHAGSQQGTAPAAGTSVCFDLFGDPRAQAAIKDPGDGFELGFNVELALRAFKVAGLPPPQLVNVPWARCLKLVQGGMVSFGLGAYYNEERAKVFSYSRHYLTLTPQVFYLARSPVAVASPADLQRYRGCGLFGGSYTHYGLQPSDLDTGVSGFQALVGKLKAGRCQYFVEELEIIAIVDHGGLRVLDDPSIEHRPVPGAVGPARHLITARGGAMEGTLKQLHAALGVLIDSGQAEAIWRRHVPQLPYNP